MRHYLPLLVIPYMSLADRMRGGLVEPDQLGGVLMGLGIAWAVGARKWWILAIVLLWMLGEAPGWGHPIGCIIDGVCTGEPEWWEIFYLKDYPYAALMFRGFLWAFPVMLLSFRFPLLISTFLMAYFMPLALWLAVGMGVDDPWAMSEWIRGMLLGAVCYMLWTYSDEERDRG